MNLSQRIKRLEKRQRPVPPSRVETVQISALAEALTTDDLMFLESKLPSIKRGELAEDHPEYQDILRRVDLAFETNSIKLTGKSYVDLLRGEADDRKRGSGKKT